MTRKNPLPVLIAVLAILAGAALVSSCSSSKHHGSSGGRHGRTGTISDEQPGDALVWVQVTDDHQSRGSCDDRGHYAAFLAAMQYIHDVIQPDFVVNTGDLADDECPHGQHQDDWDDYKNAVINAGYTSANYYDLVGNHDANKDPDYASYLANSISGVADGQTMRTWTRQVGDFTYAFVGALTSASTSEEGYFLQPAFDWTQTQLQSVNDDTEVFVLAHHADFDLNCKPHAMATDVGLLTPGGLVDTFKPNAYVGGHVHVDCERDDHNTRLITTYCEFFGEEDTPPDHSGRMRIFVLTNEISANKPKFVVGHGSQVIITFPQDQRLAVPRSPNGHMVSGPTTITAMAFGTTAPNLQMAIDGGTPVAMTTTDNRTFNATFDFGTVAAGTHTIAVQDLNNTDATNGQDSITVVSH